MFERETDVVGMPLLGHLPDLSQIWGLWNDRTNIMLKTGKLVAWLAAIILFDMCKLSSLALSIKELYRANNMLVA